MSHEVAQHLARQLGLVLPGTGDLTVSRLLHCVRELGCYAQEVGGVWQVTDASGAVLASAK